MDYRNRASDYKEIRKQDMRLTREVVRLLSLNIGDKVMDVGAGVGNYSEALEELGYRVYAVEPVDEMRKLCKNDKIIWINSFADEINLPNDTADGAIIINAIHHFSNVKKSLEEIFRVMKAGSLIIFTFDPIVATKIWLFDYWPELREYETKNYYNINELKTIISNIYHSNVEEYIFELPYDFCDVFSAATWRNPHLLLDEKTRKAMSLFNSIDHTHIENGVNRLRDDLATGLWNKKYYNISQKKSLDVGCRILKVKKI